MAGIATEPRRKMKGLAYVALLSAGFHVGLVVLKYGLSLLTGSIAIRADAFHSLVDVLSSLTIFAGIKISERKSKVFPYGLYKVENFVALITSLFIFLAAYEIVREVIHSDSGAVVSDIPIAVSGLLGIALLMFLFSRYEMRVGRKVGSPGLVADAKHIGTDLLSTGGVLIGLLLSAAGWNVDRYVAGLMAILIARLGWTIMVDSVKVLLDGSISNEMLEQIETVLFEFPQVKHVARLSGRYSGRYRFVEAEVSMDAKTLTEAHAISSSIEEEVYDRFPDVDKVLIHYEPIEEERRQLCPKAKQQVELVCC